MSGNGNSGGNHYPVGAVVGKPFAKGDDPRRATVATGRRGRLPKTIKDKFCKLFKRGFSEHAIVAILRNPNHPHFPKVLQLVLAYGYGIPKQSVELSGSVGGPPALTVIVQRNDPNRVPHPSTS